MRKFITRTYNKRYKDLKIISLLLCMIHFSNLIRNYKTINKINTFFIIGLKDQMNNILANVHY